MQYTETEIDRGYDNDPVMQMGIVIVQFNYPWCLGL